VGFINNLSFKKWVAFVVLAIFFVVIAAGCSSTSSPSGQEGTANPTPSPSEPQTPAEPNKEDGSAPKTLKVHFLDVGQADSILIQTPDGEAILVDGGNNEDGAFVVNYLKKAGVKKLAAVVATHPHEDHIGGLDTVIKNFPTERVYLPDITHTTRSFEDFIRAVKESGAKRIRAKAGAKIDISDIKAEFLAPNSSYYGDLNNYSAVLKITYGNVSFLLTGDAEAESEKEMLAKGYNLKADVLKVGHHGSTSSTTSAFLKAVAPKYAVISAGKDNDYGHPAPETLQKLNSAGVEIYRTDQDSTVIFITDGKSITIKTVNAVKGDV